MKKKYFHPLDNLASLKQVSLNCPQVARLVPSTKILSSLKNLSDIRQKSRDKSRRSNKRKKQKSVQLSKVMTHDNIKYALVQKNEVTRIRISKQRKMNMINRSQKQPYTLYSNETLGETCDYNLTDESAS